MTIRPDIEIDDAIAIAAGGYSAARDALDRPGSVERRIADARTIMVRFLENVPDDATVLDLREAIEEMP